MSIPNGSKASGTGPRRGRGKRQAQNDGSSWSLVLDMPLDIMNEFLLSVDHVYDLLSLSRSCRVFKEGLASPRALVSIWKPAMDRSTDLPPPLPGRLSIPQWVSLLRDRVCQMPKCRSSVPCRAIDFWIERRYCDDCCSKTLLASSKLRRFPWTSPHGKLALDLTWSYSPNYGPSGWHPDDLRKTDLCLAEIGEDTVKLEQFRHDRQRSMEDIKKALNTPPNVYLTWLKDTRAKDAHEASLQRPTEVRARLKELGYGEEEDIQALCQFDELKPSSTPFNTRSWGHAKKKLVAAVIEAREVRARHPWPILCARRRSAVDEIYKHFRSQSTPYEYATGFFPSTYELCLSPELKARIEAPVEEALTPETFSDLESTFSDLLSHEEERLKIKVAMAARLPSSDQQYLLATIVFPCPYRKTTSCESFLFGWKDLLQHRCFPRKTGLATGIPQEDAIVLSDVPPMEEIDLQLEAGEAVKTIVQALGLDPGSATTTDLDKLEPLVACKTCQDEQRRYGYYTWRSFILHVIASLGVKHEPKVEIESQPTHLAYSPLTAYRYSLVSQRDTGPWACNHCFAHIDGRPVHEYECTRHLSEKHNISYYRQLYMFGTSTAPTPIHMFVYDPTLAKRNTGWHPIPAIAG